MTEEILSKRVVMQIEGISAKHPIILLERPKDVVICSVASIEGDSNFDYSIIMKKAGISLDATDKEVISQICQVPSYIDSSWGFSLALSNGLTREDLDTLYPLIDILPGSRIRISSVTKRKEV